LGRPAFRSVRLCSDSERREQGEQMGAHMQRRLSVIGPAPLAYGAAFRLQEDLLERVLESERRENFLVLTEHPPVVTVGRSGKAEELLAGAAELRRRGVAVESTNRGGKLTLHAPGQLVAYPVIDLKARGADLHVYLRDLEQWLIELLGTYGLRAGTNPPYTGVWADGMKVASIGIAVRRWVAYHGVALNVANDMSLFDLIVPCGIRGVRMTSMAELLRGQGVGADDVSVEQVSRRASALFARRFGFETLVRECAPAGVESP